MNHNPFDPHKRRQRFEDPDLTRRILEQTSGRACERAGLLLARCWDETPDEATADLLGEHLSRCPACGRLVEVMALLRPLLPRLAERDPGRPFTEEVLRATSDRAAPDPGPMAALEHLVLRLWRRPRFALEAAWVSAALASLLLWSPFMPQQAPARLGQAVQAGTGLVPEAIEEIDRLARTAVSAGGQWLAPAADWVQARWREAGQHLEPSIERNRQ